MIWKEHLIIEAPLLCTLDYGPLLTIIYQKQQTVNNTKLQYVYIYIYINL